MPVCLFVEIVWGNENSNTECSGDAVVDGNHKFVSHSPATTFRCKSISVATTANLELNDFVSHY